MKFKTTVILMAAFAALLAFVLLFESKNKTKKEEEKTLVDLPSADVEKMTLKNEKGTFTFNKDDKGEWLISQPFEAKADSYEVNRLAEDFSSLKFERVVEPEAADPAKYEIPKIELTLWSKNQAQPVKLLVGMENPIGGTLFVKREDDPRIVLIAGFHKTALEKALFDFRQKDIFKFDLDNVSQVNFASKDIDWEAEKRDGEWHLVKPVSALAQKNRVEDVLRGLSNMRAKEFVSEARSDEEDAKLGLKDPEYSVALTLPSQNQKVTFSLRKQDDKIYATTSLSSKIIVAEDQVLTDINKKVEDLREKQVTVFNSWEATKVQLKKGDFTLAAAKDTEEKWHFEDGKEADKSKIETFIRKVEGLQAAEFIDSPGNLQDYGLQPPQAEVTVWTKDGDTEKQHRVLIGNEDPEKKQVVMKNARLDYLFRVDSSFLADFPKEAKDWMPPAPEEKKDEKSKGTEEKK
jgi:hypothetical protein